MCSFITLVLSSFSLQPIYPVYTQNIREAIRSIQIGRSKWKTETVYILKLNGHGLVQDWPSK